MTPAPRTLTHINHLLAPSFTTLLSQCADVSHPAKKWSLHVQWSEQINEEFFQQGDSERALGMAISPLCDRDNSSLAKSQCGFINFVVKPVFQQFSLFCRNNVWLDHLDANFKTWQARSVATQWKGKTWKEKKETFVADDNLVPKERLTQYTGSERAEQQWQGPDALARLVRNAKEEKQKRETLANIERADR